MSNSTEPIEFYGQKILVSVDELEQKWVAVKPICDALHLGRRGQQRKIGGDPKFNWGRKALVGADNKNRGMFCVSLEHLDAWLLSINSNKINPKAKEKLLIYQKECVAVLHQHFRSREGTAESFIGLTRSLIKEELAPFEERIIGRLDTVQNSVQNKIISMQAVIDELQEYVRVVFPDSDRKEIHDLIVRVGEKLNVDGRTIFGWVRRDLCTSKIYGTQIALQVKNYLRNLLGEGVLGLVKPGKEALD